MNKSFKSFLSSWLALASVSGFLAGWIFIAEAAERQVPEDGTAPTPLIPPFTPIPNVDDLVTQLPVPTGSVKTFRVILPNRPSPTLPAASPMPTGARVIPTPVPTLLQPTLAPIITPTEIPATPTDAVTPVPAPTHSNVNMPPRFHTGGS